MFVWYVWATGWAWLVKVCRNVDCYLVGHKKLKVFEMVSLHLGIDCYFISFQVIINICIMCIRNGAVVESMLTI